MEINSIDQQVTTINQRFPVFDPVRDLPRPDLTIPPDWFRSLEEVAPTITEKVTSLAVPGESWSQTIQRMLPILAMTYQQREILQIQLERARAGLPPLPNSDFGAQVSVSLDPQTRQWIVIGGLALAAAVGWMIYKRRKV